MLYAGLTPDGKLVFEFEYYRNEQPDFDYEFRHTVDSKDFASIVSKFELPQFQLIFSVIQQVTGSGRGQELVQALTFKEIENELWT